MSLYQNRDPDSIQTLQDFIDYFESIPEDQWHTGWFFSPIDPECRCAFGWCDPREPIDTKQKGDKHRFLPGGVSLFGELAGRLMDLTGSNSNLAVANDGFGQGATPKERVLRYLRSLV